MKKIISYIVLCLFSNIFIVKSSEAGRNQTGLQAQLSLQNFLNIDVEIQQISEFRPRLFVRSDEAKLGRGLTLSELKSKAKDPAYSEWIQLEDGRRGGGNMSMAMNYLLTGNKELALAVGERLANTDIPYREHTSTAAAVYHSAIAFDWVRDALPDEMAKKISEKLLEGAEHLKGGVRSPSINHNYSIVSMYGVSMAAIAIYGESEEMTQKSLEFMQLVNNMLTGENMLLEALQQKEGTWGEGNHYTPFVVFYPLLMTLRGLTTSTDTDYFEVIRSRYGNFLKPMAKFVVANFRPDFTLERIGDVLGTVVPTGRFMRPLLELLASEIDDVELQGQVSSFSQEMENFFPQPLVNSSNRWLMMVSFNSKLPSEPSYKTLPKVMRLGKDAYEHIMFRNSWNENGTLITYISGDQYTHHQHLDKGHFLIYKNGGLIVDGGGYGSPMYGDNWANYSTRTLAHNCVLVYDPEEEPWKGTSGTTIYPDGGQQVQIGKQNHKNWQQFMSQKDEDGLNTADVLAFDYDRASNRYNYVKTDLTKAYGEKVKWMDRQLMYLPDADFLVVKDRVVSNKPLKKYWLLHFEKAPMVNGKIPGTGISTYGGDSNVRSERTDIIEFGGRTVEYSGALNIKSLLPERREITVIGGPGYEYYNRFADKDFPNSRPFDPIIEPGNWRMETSTASPETSTVFLHTLEITNADKKTPIETEYISSDGKKMDGAHILSGNKNYVVLFNQSSINSDTSGNIQLPVSYKLKSKEPTIHVLTELEPDKRVKISVNGKDFGRYQTTQAGILIFEDNNIGDRNIQVLAE